MSDVPVNGAIAGWRKKLVLFFIVASLHRVYTIESYCEYLLYTPVDTDPHKVIIRQTDLISNKFSGDE